MQLQALLLPHNYDVVTVAFTTMFNRRFALWIIIGAIAWSSIFAFPARGQLPFLPKVNLETFRLNQNSKETLVSGCVRLDGLCIFQILDQKANLSQRIKFTEERLKEVSRSYFDK